METKLIIVFIDYTDIIIDDIVHHKYTISFPNEDGGGKDIHLVLTPAQYDEIRSHLKDHGTEIKSIDSYASIRIEEIESESAARIAETEAEIRKLELQLKIIKSKVQQFSMS